MNQMEILFGTNLLKVTFDNEEEFAGRKLVIKGEALAWGFDAYPETMKWLEPYEEEVIDDNTQKRIMNNILNEKFDTEFKIIVNANK